MKRAALHGNPTTRRMEVGVSARQVLGNDGTGIRAESVARGSISRRAQERGRLTAKWRKIRADLPGRRQARCRQTKEGAAQVPWGAGEASALRARPVTAGEAPQRRFCGPRRAARSSPTVGGQSERPDLMQRQLVLVEYGERWYGSRQRCLMRWAGGDTERGVETDSGR